MKNVVCYTKEIKYFNLQMAPSTPYSHPFLTFHYGQLGIFVNTCSCLLHEECSMLY